MATGAAKAKATEFVIVNKARHITMSRQSFESDGQCMHHTIMECKVDMDVTMSQ